MKITNKKFSPLTSLIVLLGLIVICLVFAVNLLYYGETKFTYYDNYQDVVNYGSIKRGWIPSNFPVSAYEIYEMHNIDTNIVWIKFRAKRNDIAQFTEQMTPHNLEDYKGVDLLIPEKESVFNRYKRINKGLLTNVYRNVRQDDFNKHYIRETVEYIAEFITDNNETSFYYWTNGGKLVAKN